MKPNQITHLNDEVGSVYKVHWKLAIEMLSWFCLYRFIQYTGQQKKTFFQNALEIYTYSGAEWCPKHDVAFRFSLN